VTAGHVTRASQHRYGRCVAMSFVGDILNLSRYSLRTSLSPYGRSRRTYPIRVFPYLSLLGGYRWVWRGRGVSVCAVYTGFLAFGFIVLVLVRWAGRRFGCARASRVGASDVGIQEGPSLWRWERAVCAVLDRAGVSRWHRWGYCLRCLFWAYQFLSFEWRFGHV